LFSIISSDSVTALGKLTVDVLKDRTKRLKAFSFKEVSQQYEKHFCRIPHTVLLAAVHKATGKCLVSVSVGGLVFVQQFRPQEDNVHHKNVQNQTRKHLKTLLL